MNEVSHTLRRLGFAAATLLALIAACAGAYRLGISLIHEPGTGRYQRSTWFSPGFPTTVHADVHNFGLRRDELRWLDDGETSSDALLAALQDPETEVLQLRLWQTEEDRGWLIPHTRVSVSGAELRVIGAGSGAPLPLAGPKADRVRAYLRGINHAAALRIMENNGRREHTLWGPLICEIVTGATAMASLPALIVTLAAALSCARALRTRSRLARGVCPDCLYDISDVKPDGYGVKCPECGHTWPPLADYGTQG